MRVRNISKIVLYYVKIHRKHIGKTIVVHNLKVSTTVVNSFVSPTYDGCVASGAPALCAYVPLIAINCPGSTCNTIVVKVEQSNRR